MRCNYSATQWTTAPSTNLPTNRSRIATASLVRLEPPLAITPLLIVRVTLAVD